MGSLTQLETTLDSALNKNAPVKIPPEGRKGLAGATWWLALILGVLQLWSAITLWQWGHTVDRLADTLSYYSDMGYNTPHLGLFYYLSLLAMAGTAVLALLAVPSLKAMKKSGWDMLFYCALIAAVLSVIRLFSSGGGFFDFVGTAIGTVIGAWLLFQVRDFFMADVSAVRARQHTAAADPVSAPDHSAHHSAAKKHDDTTSADEK